MSARFCAVGIWLGLWLMPTFGVWAVELAEASDSDSNSKLSSIEAVGLQESGESVGSLESKGSLGSLESEASVGSRESEDLVGSLEPEGSLGSQESEGSLGSLESKDLLGSPASEGSVRADDSAGADDPVRSDDFEPEALSENSASVDIGQEPKASIPLLSRLSFGLDAQLLFREEAGGSRAPYPSLAPRLAFQLWRGLSTSLNYGWYLRNSEIGVGRASERHHRLQLRADYAWQIRALSLGAGLGAVGAYQRSTFESAPGPTTNSGETFAASAFRAGLSGGLALEIALPLQNSSSWLPSALFLRTGLDVLWIESRVDLLTFAGIAIPLGKAP